MIITMLGISLLLTGCNPFSSAAIDHINGSMSGQDTFENQELQEWLQLFQSSDSEVDKEISKILEKQSDSEYLQDLESVVDMLSEELDAKLEEDSEPDTVFQTAEIEDGSADVIAVDWNSTVEVEKWYREFCKAAQEGDYNTYIYHADKVDQEQLQTIAQVNAASVIAICLEEYFDDKLVEVFLADESNNVQYHFFGFLTNVGNHYIMALDPGRIDAEVGKHLCTECGGTGFVTSGQSVCPICGGLGVR